MKIKFFGAAGEVTGSSYLVDTGKSKVLVDLGMFQGIGSDEKNPVLPDIKPSELAGVILTHAHLDHCGRIPLLISRAYKEKGVGFDKKIWMTKPTVELTDLVLADAAHIMEGPAEAAGNLPLYSQIEASEIVGHFTTVDYDRVQAINDEISFKMLDAGHILGSSSIQMEIKAANGSRKTVVFSGDLGNEPSPIVGLVDEPRQADTVIIETTYGNRMHQPRGKEEAFIAQLSKEIMASSGTLLMPAFSLERTQELLNIFDKLKKTGVVSEGLRVYLDSPMGTRATAIYEKYESYFNERMKEVFKRDDPFDFPGLVITAHHNQSLRIDDDLGPKVIIAGSGMMSGGRIIHHASKWLSDPKTVLLFNGFQAKGTLGRHILDGDRSLMIQGKLVEVKARVESIETMSGHADAGQLMGWLKQIQGVKKVILTHGEDIAREAFGLRIEEELGLEVIKPYLNDVVEI